MDAPTGGWRCLDCHWVCAAVPDPDSAPTCGQREVMYCSNCNTLKCLEFTLMVSPPPQHRILRPTAAGFHPTAAQLERLGVANESTAHPSSVALVDAVSSAGSKTPSHEPRLGSSSNGVAHMMLPDPASFSEMTAEGLVKLQARVKEYGIAVEKELNDRTLCVACYASPKETIFYPCKHKCLCRQCSDKVQQCPICRVTIVDRIVPYDA